MQALLAPVASAQHGSEDFGKCDKDILLVTPCSTAKSRGFTDLANAGADWLEVGLQALHGSVAARHKLHQRWAVCRLLSGGRPLCLCHQPAGDKCCSLLTRT